MNAQNFKKRLQKLEQPLSPSGDCSCTLEQLCRSIWRADKKRFLVLAKSTNLTYFIPQFQFEDAEQLGRRPGGRVR